MRYFKAFEIVEKPLIKWEKWADSLAQLTAMGEEDNPLILAEEDIPAIEFGICPLKIVTGHLVARTSPEMDEYESQWESSEFLAEQKALQTAINNGTFTYDSQTFPMDERSRIFYQAFDRARGIGDVKCMTATGHLYSLDNSNIDDFLDAYFLRLRTLSQPNV